MAIKDVTPTIFGLVIAYVVPGLFALLTLALFFDPVAELIASFKNAQSSVGLFLIVFLIVLMLGMQLHAFRWLIFEKIVFSRKKITPAEFAALRSPDIAATFRMIVDENYRYHQCFGAQFLITPFFFYGVAGFLKIDLHSCSAMFIAAVVLVAIIILWIVAAEGFDRYINRAKAILGGQSDGNGLRSDEGKGGDKESGEEDGQGEGSEEVDEKDG